MALCLIVRFVPAWIRIPDLVAIMVYHSWGLLALRTSYIYIVLPASVESHQEPYMRFLTLIPNALPYPVSFHHHHHHPRYGPNSARTHNSKLFTYISLHLILELQKHTFSTHNIQLSKYVTSTAHRAS